MDTHDFIARYGGIYEHSPWVAEQIAPLAAGIDDADQLAELMADCVDNAAETADSTAEQASAGLHQCSKVQYEKFQALNDAYKEKFGFPFVMAVRGSSCEEILELFSKRLKNNYEVEFETALAEIHKIARLRLGAIEKDA
jgi:2-oxo-4-hydroxy-4-carboxy--5-ureidoimidazoline (OHCU) decarboxylase